MLDDNEGMNPLRCAPRGSNSLSTFPFPARPPRCLQAMSSLFSLRRPVYGLLELSLCHREHGIVSCIYGLPLASSHLTSVPRFLADTTSTIPQQLSDCRNGVIPATVLAAGYRLNCHQVPTTIPHNAACSRILASVRRFQYI